jgi:hypothetical protein
MILDENPLKMNTLTREQKSIHLNDEAKEVLILERITTDHLFCCNILCCHSFDYFWLKMPTKKKLDKYSNYPHR